MVVDYAPMARRMARRFSFAGVPDDDLDQVAMLGLLLAARRYDRTIGAFGPFATATIRGELKKHLRDNGWTARVPRRLQEASITIETVRGRLEQELQRSPSVDEIAAACGLSAEEVVSGLRVRHSRFAYELDGQQSVESGEAADLEVDQMIDLRNALAELDEFDAELIRLAFVEEESQREIGKQMHMSQPTVHRRLTAATEKLRRRIATQGGTQ